MKLAFAGKGGTGKTTLTAWTGDYLSRLGHDVWLIDADTALSLGAACGIHADQLPVPLILREDLILKHIGCGMISLNPDVSELAQELAVVLPDSDLPTFPKVRKRGKKRLLVMGSITNAGGGCACEANALLKALLAHLVFDRKDYVLIDLEAGVEHLGRGTVFGIDGLVIVSEPSWRSLNTAAAIVKLATQLGLKKQVLCLNRSDHTTTLPQDLTLPEAFLTIPVLKGLQDQMLSTGSVLNLPEQAQVDTLIEDILLHLR